MPREPRIYIENVLYLVTAKGDKDRNLFCDSQDFNAYLKSLSEYKREYGFKLFAFALLPKNLCLLIELKNSVTISTIMHDLNSRYTKTYNGRYGKNGHLFQSRFKSVLIEKDDYLLRISRYIHLLPKDSGMTNDPADYLYSSFTSYLSEDIRMSFCGEMLDMHAEIKEVLSRFMDMETDDSQRGAYEGYVRSADDKEAQLVRKLLHRKAFVGSRDFIGKIRSEIKQHIIEEEESRIVRKTNPGFVLAGGLVVLFLGTVAYNFYNNQSTLQEALNVTAGGFETAREDLANRIFSLQTAREDLTKRLYSLQDELTKLEDTNELNGAAWEIHITPLNDSNMEGVTTDVIYFKDNQVTIKSLSERGFSAFDYTLASKSPGRMIWKAAKTRSDGTNVQMEGLWTGKKVKGIVRERPIQGENRDFTFVSVRRVSKTRRAQNVVQ
ncbi:MAG: transposase [Candidatus Omnitrophica bacterium]|nr:transposase [Candidatus Omnitrophota bacterium]